MVDMENMESNTTNEMFGFSRGERSASVMLLAMSDTCGICAWEISAACGPEPATARPMGSRKAGQAAKAKVASNTKANGERLVIVTGTAWSLKTR